MATIIAGGAGFIGSNLANLLAKRGHNTIIIDNNNNNNYTINNNITILKENCFDSFIISEVLKKDVNIFIDLVDESFYNFNDDIAKNNKFIDTNLVGFTNLMHVMLNHWMNVIPDVQKQRFRYIKLFSADILKSNQKDIEQTTSIDENTPIDPSSIFGAALAYKIHAINALQKSFSLPTINIISGNAYGNNQTKGIIPNIFNNAINEQSIQIHGNGKHIRNWVHVNDLCNAIYITITRGKPGSRYHISTEENIQTIDLANLCCEIMDEMFPRQNKQQYSELIRFTSYNKMHLLQKICDSKKSKLELGFTTNTKLKDGIKEFFKLMHDKKKQTDSAKT